MSQRDLLSYTRIDITEPDFYFDSKYNSKTPMPDKWYEDCMKTSYLSKEGKNAVSKIIDKYGYVSVKDLVDLKEYSISKNKVHSLEGIQYSLLKTTNLLKASYDEFTQKSILEYQDKTINNELLLLKNIEKKFYFSLICYFIGIFCLPFNLYIHENMNNVFYIFLNSFTYLSMLAFMCVFLVLSSKYSFLGMILSVIFCIYLYIPESMQFKITLKYFTIILTCAFTLNIIFKNKLYNYIIYTCCLDILWYGQLLKGLWIYGYNREVSNILDKIFIKKSFLNSEEKKYYHTLCIEYNKNNKVA